MRLIRCALIKLFTEQKKKQKKMRDKACRINNLKTSLEAYSTDVIF